MDSIEKLLAEAEKAIEAEKAAAQAAQPASMLPEDLDFRIQKAVTEALSQSREGVGRVSQQVEKGVSLDSDPVAHLVRKAGEVDFDADGALTQDEKDAIVGFWNATFWGDPNPEIAEGGNKRHR